MEYVDRTIGKKFPEKTQIYLLYNLTLDTNTQGCSQQAVYVLGCWWAGWLVGLVDGWLMAGWLVGWCRS